MNAQPKLGPREEEELYRWFMPVARVFFMHHGGEERDLAHEAFAIGLEALRAGKIRETDRIGGFMLGVCRNLVRERARKDARTDRAMALVAAAEPPLPPTTAADSAVDGYKLWQCVNALNARARSVIIGTYVDDEDAEAIARREATTASNVRVMRHRALAALLACIEGGAR